MEHVCAFLGETLVIQEGFSVQEAMFTESHVEFHNFAREPLKVREPRGPHPLGGKSCEVK